MGGGGGGGVARGGGGRERKDADGDLHAAETQAVAADEVVGFGLVERDEVLAGAPVPGQPVHRAVVVPSLVHLEHVVHVLLVPKRWQWDLISRVRVRVLGSEG